VHCWEKKKRNCQKLKNGQVKDTLQVKNEKKKGIGNYTTVEASGAKGYKEKSKVGGGKKKGTTPVGYPKPQCFLKTSQKRRSRSQEGQKSMTYLWLIQRRRNRTTMDTRQHRKNGGRRWTFEKRRKGKKKVSLKGI